MGGWGSWDDQADMHQRFVSEPCGWCSTTRNTATRNGRRPVGGREGRLLVGDAAALGPADRARSRTPPGVDDRRAGAVERPSPGDPGTATRQRDLAEGLGVFRAGGARPPTEAMVAFIDAHRAPSGVEPICAVLSLADRMCTRSCTGQTLGCPTEDGGLDGAREPGRKLGWWRWGLPHAAPGHPPGGGGLRDAPQLGSLSCREIGWNAVRERMLPASAEPCATQRRRAVQRGGGVRLTRVPASGIIDCTRRPNRY